MQPNKFNNEAAEHMINLIDTLITTPILSSYEPKKINNMHKKNLFYLSPDDDKPILDDYQLQSHNIISDTITPPWFEKYKTMVNDSSIKNIKKFKFIESYGVSSEPNKLKKLSSNKKIISKPNRKPSKKKPCMDKASNTNKKITIDKPIIVNTKIHANNPDTNDNILDNKKVSDRTIKKDVRKAAPVAMQQEIFKQTSGEIFKQTSGEIPKEICKVKANKINRYYAPSSNIVKNKEKITRIKHIGHYNDNDNDIVDIINHIINIIDFINKIICALFSFIYEKVCGENYVLSDIMKAFDLFLKIIFKKIANNSNAGILEQIVK